MNINNESSEMTQDEVAVAFLGKLARPKVAALTDAEARTQWLDTANKAGASGAARADVLRVWNATAIEFNRSRRMRLAAFNKAANKAAHNDARALWAAAGTICPDCQRLDSDCVCDCADWG